VEVRASPEGAGQEEDIGAAEKPACRPEDGGLALGVEAVGKAISGWPARFAGPSALPMRTSTSPKNSWQASISR
jgi:hypothetical protein